MISYYVIYRTKAGVGRPEGLFVLAEKTGGALLWDHRAKGWGYDPALVLRYLDDPQQWDRIQPVSRAKAEEAAMAVTGAREALPDEETIRRMLQEQAPPPVS